MQIKIDKKNTKIRAILHIFSLFFILSITYIFSNQPTFIHSIINKYFNLDFSTIMYLFTTNNWLTVLSNNVQHMVIHLISFFLIEILLTTVGFIFIFYLLWKIRKKTQWLFQEKLIFFGYLFLLITLLLFGSSIIYSTYITFSTIKLDINKLSQVEIQTILSKIDLALNQSTLSFNNFFQYFIQLFEKIKNILYAVDKIATIPTMVQQWWANLLSLRQYVFIGIFFNFSVIIVGHLIELWHFFSEKKQFSLFKKRSETTYTDEQLLYVIKQQQQILHILEKEKIKNS